MLMSAVNPHVISGRNNEKKKKNKARSDLFPALCIFWLGSVRDGWEVAAPTTATHLACVRGSQGHGRTAILWESESASQGISQTRSPLPFLPGWVSLLTACLLLPFPAVIQGARGSRSRSRCWMQNGDRVGAHVPPPPGHGRI